MIFLLHEDAGWYLLVSSEYEQVRLVLNLVEYVFNCPNTRNAQEMHKSSLGLCALESINIGDCDGNGKVTKFAIYPKGRLCDTLALGLRGNSIQQKFFTPPCVLEFIRKHHRSYFPCHSPESVEGIVCFD